MVSGALVHSGAGVAVAVTGIAGPGGGTEDNRSARCGSRGSGAAVTRAPKSSISTATANRCAGRPRVAALRIGQRVGANRKSSAERAAVPRRPVSSPHRWAPVRIAGCGYHRGHMDRSTRGQGVGIGEQATKNAAATGNDSRARRIRATGAALPRDVERRPWFWKRLHATGVNVIRQNFYAEVPSVDDIENSFEFAEDRLFDDAGVSDPGQVEEFAESLGSAREADWREAPADGPARYYWNNPAFSYSDAMATLLRHPQVQAAAHRTPRSADIRPWSPMGLARPMAAASSVLFEPFPKVSCTAGDGTLSRIDAHFSQQIGGGIPRPAQ